MGAFLSALPYLFIALSAACLLLLARKDVRRGQRIDVGPFRAIVRVKIVLIVLVGSLFVAFFISPWGVLAFGSLYVILALVGIVLWIVWMLLVVGALWIVGRRSSDSGQVLLS